jgi:hypothetical protein
LVKEKAKTEVYRGVMVEVNQRAKIQHYLSN